MPTIKLFQLLILLLVLLSGCQGEKCVSFSDLDGKTVNAFVYRIDEGQFMSINQFGTLIGVSKGGEICIRPSGNFSIANDYFRIEGLRLYQGKVYLYQDKIYDSFEAIPSVVVFEKLVINGVAPSVAIPGTQ